MSQPTDDGEVPLADLSAEKAAQAPAGGKAATDDDAHGDDEQRSAADLEAVFDIPVHIAAVLGRTHIEVSNLLKLDEGDVIELDRKVGEAIDIFVNNRLVARGEVVLVEDRLGITMTEIIKADRAS